MCSLRALITKGRLRWLGHVRRMDTGRIPKDHLYGELVEGRRKLRRPKLRLNDACRRDLIKCSIEPDTWERQAEDRSAWRAAVRQGTLRAEAERIETATQRRARRMHLLINAPTAAGFATPRLDCTVTLGGAVSQTFKATNHRLPRRKDTDDE